MPKSGIKGGDKLVAYLTRLRKELAGAPIVQAGFMEDANYPDGTPIASVAAVNEFGGTIKVPEHEVTVYKKLNKAGTDYLRGGRFVKREQANIETTHTVPAHTITIPPRPFFRNAIAQGKQTWGKNAGKLLVVNNYAVEKTLGEIGTEMQGDITQSIRNFSDPPNAKSTIAKKGFDKPLIDKGIMVRAVSSKVNTGG